MGIFRSHTTYNRADKISSFSVSTAEYGSAVPEVFGTTRRSGNVIYYDDFTAHEHRESHKAGKGGRKKTVTISYTYTVAAILGLCEGPITGIGKVWVGKSVYDYPSEDIGLSCWNGTNTQEPWGYVQGRHPDKALPYKGLAYMAGVVDLGDNATFPTYNFEIKGKLLSSGDYIDANPADVIRYILDKTGLSGVAIDGLDNYRRYCRENDLLISSPMDDTNARETREIINEIISLTNAYMFWSNDHYKIVVLDDQAHGSWKPDTTIRYNLTADDFIEQSNGALVTYSRKDSSEVYNQYPVEFISRANSYDKETVSYALSKDVAEHGIRQASTTKAHWFYTKERAVKVAQALARKAQYSRNQYTFKLPWTFCLLEVGDLVTLTDASIGLDKQVVRISAVTESAQGLLTITAISTPPMDVSAPQYDVHANDRPYVDYNVTAPDTDTPVIIQPPADLTSNGLELWIGAKGKGDLWGGCEVYASDDNTTYRSMGMISNSARIGTLAANVTKDATTVVITSNGDFLSGTAQDAERGNTLCWVDGECFSYQTAKLLDNGNWELSGCVRGQYFTTATAHKSGVQFARLDSTLLKVPFTKADIGKKIWLKFVSYNIFGAGNQDLSKVRAYQYTIQPYYIPPVTGITCYNRYRQQSDGVSRYDIVVKWTPPNLFSYLEGRVWYKTDHGQTLNLTAASGVKASTLGFSGEWIYGGSGKDQVVIPQAVVGDTYRICVVTVDEWGASTSPDLAPSKDITVALKTYLPNTPDGFSIELGASAVASWKEVTNTDISFYEIRLDTAVGVESGNLLVRTNGLKATLPLTSRIGTLYLYAVNALGKYSDPAILKYHKDEPPKPDVPVLTATLGGFGVTAKAIPNGCSGMAVYIDSKDVIRTPNNVYSYTCGAGVYVVTIAYYDLFGEGPKSEEATVTVKVKISQDMLDDEAVSLAKVDKTIKDAVAQAQTATTDIVELKKTDKSIQTTVADTKKELASQITQNADKITSVVTNLGDAAKAKTAYSAIAQMQDDIALRVKSDDVVSQINLSKEGVQIDGKLVHVTGDTLFDDNIVTNKMLQAGAVTADKVSVDKLSAITANVGALKGGTITGTNIVGTNFRNTSGTFTVDDSGNIYGATLKSGTIDGNTIRINGYNVRAVTIMRGVLWADDDVNNGHVTVPLPAGYTEDQCIWRCYTQGGYVSDNEFYHNWQQPIQVLSTSDSTSLQGNDYLKSAYRSRLYYCDNSIKDHWVAYWIIGVK